MPQTSPLGSRAQNWLHVEERREPAGVRRPLSALGTSESFRAKFRLDPCCAQLVSRAVPTPLRRQTPRPRRYAFPLVLLVRQPRHHLMSRSRSPLLAASAAPRNLRCRARSASTRSVGVSRSILNSRSTPLATTTAQNGRTWSARRPLRLLCARAPCLAMRSRAVPISFRVAASRPVTA